MGIIIFFTKVLSFCSVLGSLFIVISYVKFPVLQDFTFLIVAHMAIANALMNFSMMFLHGSIVVPLCSSSTLIFYSAATSYVYFVSTVSYLLYRKIVLRSYLVRDELQRRIVITGWVLPLLWLTIPSAIPSFWSMDGKLIDGCKQLSEAALNMNISHGHDASGLYLRAILRISVFLFLPSCVSVLFNCFTIFHTRKALKEGKRMAATQKWLENIPVVSLETSSNNNDILGSSKTCKTRRNTNTENPQYYHSANKASKPEEFLEFEFLHEPVKNSNNFEAHSPSPFSKQSHHVIDYEHRSALDVSLMERFSKYPIVFVLCWILGAFIFFLYMITGSTHALELAIFHFANAGMGEYAKRHIQHSNLSHIICKYFSIKWCIECICAF